MNKALLIQKISEKSNDDDHPYGHERMECVAAIILAVMLALVGAGIGYNGIVKMISWKNLQIPGMFALIAAVISVIVNLSGVFKFFSVSLWSNPI